MACGPSGKTAAAAERGSCARSAHALCCKIRARRLLAHRLLPGSSEQICYTFIAVATPCTHWLPASLMPVIMYFLLSPASMNTRRLITNISEAAERSLLLAAVVELHASAFASVSMCSLRMAPSALCVALAGTVAQTVPAAQCLQTWG